MFKNRSGSFGLCVALIALVGACRSTPAEPESHSVLTAEPTSSAAPTETASLSKPAAAATASAAPSASAKPTPSVPVSPDDPMHGKFTLDDATAGLAGKGPLSAEIDTELGKLECDLYDDKAPITVANFVGLARGLRPFKAPDGKWNKKPAYDGTTFHRVIKGFMIQGGDPSGTGAGEPGYVIPDEVWPGATHDQIGQICMANRGPNTNGQQFFIMDGVAKHLDSGYTIFGKCSPESVIEKLASVEVRGDHAVTPTKIKSIKIKRKAANK
ncbi:MAG TPA: peptidylprolyl isomerase [Polyangiaceae bacterium]|jgi:peptidyl-prolyl cis-trans isomerase A (cyclophilin A)